MSNLGVVKYLWHPWYVVYMLRQLANGVTRTPAVAKLDELADGEVLDVPGCPRVVHAPGHTAGSCASREPWRQGVKSAVDIARQAASS